MMDDPRIQEMLSDPDELHTWMMNHELAKHFPEMYVILNTTTPSLLLCFSHSQDIIAATLTQPLSLCV